MKELKEHPSDIAQAAERYIEAMQTAETMPSCFPQVLYLFIEYLCLHMEGNAAKNPDRLLCHNWAQCTAKTISRFIDHWMPQVILNQALSIHAPTILRRWVIWCYKHRYFSQSSFRDYLGVLPRDKSKDIERCIKAGELLYELHCPDKALWKEKRDKVIRLNLKRSPQDNLSGRLTLTALDVDKVFFQTQDGISVGPVLLGKPLVRLLRIGDILHVEIARFDNCWHVLNSGAVYAKGAVFDRPIRVDTEPNF